MKSLGWKISVLIFLSAISVNAQFEQPFKWNSTTDGHFLIVSVEIPPAHYLYADDRTKITVAGPQIDLQPLTKPKTVKHSDEFGFGKIFPAGKNIWKYEIQPEKTYKITIEFQGCKEKTKESPGICFIPSETTFTVHFSPKEKKDVVAETSSSNPRKGEPESTELTKLLNQFEVINTGGGYLNKEEFLAFLNKTPNEAVSNNLAGKNTWLMLFLVLLGGLILNLTPCVLPMIPINLAIIGAGKLADNKQQGFIRGGVYGAGIAIAYGILGIITVLSGAKFGTLNSYYLFNFLVAVVFIILALAMFGVFHIDFTKFSSKIGIKQTGKGELLPIFFMGIVAALLAGACVAPVVIAVLLHSTRIYTEGSLVGLLLPFVLGFGMALPWPLAGAGLAALPKPGNWMVRVKQVLGIFILVFAGYYIYIGIALLPTMKDLDPKCSFVALKQGLLHAKKEKKPVFIDFWASWCKNCSEMEKTTFKDPEVIQEMKSYVVVKFQAEKPNQPEIKKLLDRYQLIGLPGYVILKVKE